MQREGRRAEKHGNEMLKSFDEYIALAEEAHGHMCAGQILGLRMALYGSDTAGTRRSTGATASGW